MKCPFSEKGCGGCRNIDVMYGELLRRKDEAFHRLFPDALKIVGAQEPCRYRSKVLRTFAQGKESLYTGIYREGTHRVISVRDCLLENKEACDIAARAGRILADLHVPAYREDFHTGVLRHLQVRRAPATGQAVVTVIAAAPFPQEKLFADRLMAACPEVRGVTRSVNNRSTSAVMGYTSQVLAGRDEIWDELGGLHVCLSSRSFYQVNSAQAEKLYKKAIELAALTPQDTVLDAYCGIGLIGLMAARQAGHVTGIELVKASVDNAVINARVNRIKNADFMLGDAVKALKSGACKPDVVFMDPPRAGCSAEFLQALTASPARRAVYVSCSPETLRRDVNLLVRAGWHMESVQPYDLFPYTEHTEAVVLLSREK